MNSSRDSSSSCRTAIFSLESHTCYPNVGHRSSHFELRTITEMFFSACQQLSCNVSIHGLATIVLTESFRLNGRNGIRYKAEVSIFDFSIYRWCKLVWAQYVEARMSTMSFRRTVGASDGEAGSRVAEATRDKVSGGVSNTSF